MTLVRDSLLDVCPKLKWESVERRMERRRAGETTSSRTCMISTPHFLIASLLSSSSTWSSSDPEERFDTITHLKPLLLLSKRPARRK
eukprot:397661-Hanusia_phi.AAC.1